MANSNSTQLTLTEDERFWRALVIKAVRDCQALTGEEYEQIADNFIRHVQRDKSARAAKNEVA